jgi:hypothetical protein
VKSLTTNENNFGIIRHDLLPKAVYEAYKVVANTLEDFEPDGYVELARDIEVLCFRRGVDGVTAVWTSGENIKRQIPVRSLSVRSVMPLAEDETIDAQNGWATIDLTVVPRFLISE